MQPPRLPCPKPKCSSSLLRTFCGSKVMHQSKGTVSMKFQESQVRDRKTISVSLGCRKPVPRGTCVITESENL